MRSIAAGALIATLLCAPAHAQPGAQPTPRPSAPPIDRLGQIEPAPVAMTSTLMRLRNDLTILRAALEGYRAAHFYRYPEASSPEALFETLVHTEDLPEGFTLHGTITEFVANRGGYRISAGIKDAVVTIRPPERFDPFWAMLLQPL
ncbi:MAG TPA: hypothetical protein V6D05_04750 [Stenomitos sp.]